MLAEHCGGRRSLQTTSPRRLTYSSLSRYHNKSIIKRQDEQNSASYSGSDETQRPITSNNCKNNVKKKSYNNHKHELSIDEEQSINKNNKLSSSSIINLVEPHVICHIVNDNNDLNNCKLQKKNSIDSNCQNQITIVTSLAKSFNEGCHNNGGLSHTPVNKCHGKGQRPLKNVSLGNFIFFFLNFNFNSFFNFNFNSCYFFLFFF